jgi:hypothetical protein
MICHSCTAAALPATDNPTYCIGSSSLRCTQNGSCRHSNGRRPDVRKKSEGEAGEWKPHELDVARIGGAMKVLVPVASSVVGLMML